MNNIAIVEDQPDQAEFIAESVARFPGCVDVSVECFSTADELADYLEEGNIVDICFMDIDLGEGGEFEDGIDAVRKLFPEGYQSAGPHWSGKRHGDANHRNRYQRE